MTDTTPKLTAINDNLYIINKNISIIDNNTKIIDTSYENISALKLLSQHTLKQKKTLYAELYKIHTLKLNSDAYITTTNSKYNRFKLKFSITGGSTTLTEEEKNIQTIEKRKQSMKDFLTYKSYLETEQQKYGV